MARKRNYVNNREMLGVLTEYLAECKKAEDKAYTEHGLAGLEPEERAAVLKKVTKYPQVPKYLAECFTQIADRLGMKPNFSGYSYLEDMKSDGKINCIQYIRNFNPEKSNNPFAYFTQIIKFAFIRRIEMEKKQLYVKYKTYQNLQLSDQIDGSEGVGAPELNEISNDYIDTFEKKLLTAKEKSVRTKPVKSANTVTDLME